MYSNSTRIPLNHPNGKPEIKRGLKRHFWLIIGHSGLIKRITGTAVKLLYFYEHFTFSRRGIMKRHRGGLNLPYVAYSLPLWFEAE